MHEFMAEHLPLVSVLIVNYNYELFLADAVESVFSQTYPNLECILVDDCSTDNSDEAIAEVKRRFPALICIKNDRNSGQSISSYNGFMKSAGAFVIFLDADDFLFPSCVETHVRTHLSLRLPVGLTSVDMTQVVNGKVTTTTSQGFSDFVRSKAGLVESLCRPNALVSIMLGQRDHRLFASQLHYVPPSCYYWPWSPTSGNCFRRDALDLIIHNERFDMLRSCTDIYLLRGVAALTGSVLIDQPLAGYRIHNTNAFIKTATIHQIRVFNPTYLKKRSDIAISLLIEHLIDNVSMLLTRLESPSYFVVALNALDGAWPPIIDNPRKLSYLTRKLILRRSDLIRALGWTDYNNWLIQRLRHDRSRRKRLQPGKAILGTLIGLVAGIDLFFRTRDWSATRHSEPFGKEEEKPSK